MCAEADPRYRAYAYFLLRGSLHNAALVPLDPDVPLCGQSATPHHDESLHQSCARGCVGSLAP